MISGIIASTAMADPWTKTATSLKKEKQVADTVKQYFGDHDKQPS